jgi:electron transfer flavoprotein beta subunit
MALRKIGDVSLVVCGRQAADGDTAQVGPGIAAHLGLPQITYVRKIESVDEKRIVAQRMLETGHEVIESPLPCVVTVTKEINDPRIPTFKGKMAAKKAAIVTWTAADIGAAPGNVGLEGSPTKVVKIFTPPARSGGEMLRGEPAEVVRALVEKLQSHV